MSPQWQAGTGSRQVDSAASPAFPCQLTYQSLALMTPKVARVSYGGKRLSFPVPIPRDATLAVVQVYNLNPRKAQVFVHVCAPQHMVQVSRTPLVPQGPAGFHISRPEAFQPP